MVRFLNAAGLHYMIVMKLAEMLRLNSKKVHAYSYEILTVMLICAVAYASIPILQPFGPSKNKLEIMIIDFYKEMNYTHCGAEDTWYSSIG